MCFDKNSLAYVFTNEDLRTSMAFMPENCKRALVCAASGDHPLFCSLRAALQYRTTITVDTFDITPNAKAAMDIKTAAIMGGMRRSEYLNLLENVCSDGRLKFMDLYRVSAKLPPETLKYIIFKEGWLFRDDAVFNEKDHFFPTKYEYQTLREIIKKPYDFIQTGIADLGAKLDDKMYDFMHLSNIFDYVERGQFAILQPLLRHVNVGGRIVLQHFSQCCSLPLEGYLSVKTFSDKSCGDWRFSEKIDWSGDFDSFIVCERVR